MKILLDTHIAIWAVLDSEELSNTARAMILESGERMRREQPHKDPFD